MTSIPHNKVGRNDPCPCGSGKKYKRCCQLTASVSRESAWRSQHEASERLAQDMLRFVAREFLEDEQEAWRDFNMSDLPLPFIDRSTESQIFGPFFLFHWDPDSRTKGRSAYGEGGIVLRQYVREKANILSEMDMYFLDQAITQPVSFHEILWSEPGERMGIRDAFTGEEIVVTERSASRTLRQGDMAYAQVWKLPSLAILGCCAPTCIPPRWKADVIRLRSKLRKRIAKQNRDLHDKDLVRYGDDIREAYLDIRDILYAPPRLCNTDGEPLVFHTLTFRIESAEEAFEALAPLALGRSKKDLLWDAEFADDDKLHGVQFDWLKKGNRTHAAWDNTIMGTIKISARSLVAEVNSEKRAKRLRAEIEKRLGRAAVHRSTLAQTAEEMLERKRAKPPAEADEEHDALRDPDVRQHAQEALQKDLEAWVEQKIPALGGRTPLQAVHDPDGKEIVESLVLEWERLAEKSIGPGEIRPDVSVLRKLLNLTPPADRRSRDAGVP
jgi:SEC-C motif